MRGRERERKRDPGNKAIKHISDWALFLSKFCSFLPHHNSCPFPHFFVPCLWTARTLREKIASTKSRGR